MFPFLPRKFRPKISGGTKKAKGAAVPQRWVSKPELGEDSACVRGLPRAGCWCPSGMKKVPTLEGVVKYIVLEPGAG